VVEEIEDVFVGDVEKDVVGDEVHVGEMEIGEGDAQRSQSLVIWMKFESVVPFCL